MSSSLFELHPSLSETTTLYRTMDFFSAASIVSNRELMFTRADVFPDKNEGIDRILAQLHSAGHGGCGGMGWNDIVSASEQHEKVKRSHYISCWSKTAESVAMWSLYSPDQCSVRVSTSTSKLRQAVEALLEKYSFTRLSNDDLGNNVVVAVSGQIVPVTYSSLGNIAQRITRRVKAFRRIESRYNRLGKPLPKFGEINHRYYEREQQRRLKELRDTCRLKDSSFGHEDEVRLCIRLGEEPWAVANSSLKSEYLDSAHKYHVCLREELNVFRFVFSAKTPPREFVRCRPDLVESVAIDPRCPPHKAKFIRDWFSSRGIRVVESTCFGYLPESFAVFPKK